MDLIHKAHKEIGSRYYHKPQVQGMEYSALIVESNTGVGEGGETFRDNPGRGFLSNISPAMNCIVSFFCGF
jgi:hypothetical protein